MDKYRLGIDRSSDYNPDTDPSITNAFATAAYRFGHTMIASMVKLIDLVTAAETTYQLKDNFFDSSVYEAKMEAVLNGMMGQNAESFDVNVVPDVTESLFANVGFPGSDLVARNIQRGRDHGLPGYNEFREGLR